jgi:hypothetical protein
MEIVLTTNSPRSVLWKAWRESRARFFSALVLLILLVAYAVLTGPGFLARYNAHFPDKPLLYSVYVWTGLFHYALEGLWVLAALVVALGGLAREKATSVALFSLALSVSRLNLFLIRATHSDPLSIRRLSLSLSPGTRIRRVDKRGGTRNSGFWIIDLRDI